MLDALVLGTRHGVDADHLAAISELTASQRGGWRGFVLGIRYAAGHAAMVATLGLVAAGAGVEMPDWVIGLTLIGLGAWAMSRLRRGVLYEHEHEHDHRDGGLHDHRHHFAPSRPHRHQHGHAVAVGAVHGLGGAPSAVLLGGRGGLGILPMTSASTHVFGSAGSAWTHVFAPAHLTATGPTLRYTPAGRA